MLCSARRRVARVRHAPAEHGAAEEGEGGTEGTLSAAVGGHLPHVFLQWSEASPPKLRRRLVFASSQNVFPNVASSFESFLA